MVLSFLPHTETDGCFFTFGNAFGKYRLQRSFCGCLDSLVEGGFDDHILGCLSGEKLWTARHHPIGKIAAGAGFGGGAALFLPKTGILVTSKAAYAWYACENAALLHKASVQQHTSSVKNAPL